MRSRGPEQISAQVTHLASDQIDGALSKGVTESRREDCRVGREVVGGRYLGGTAPPYRLARSR